MNERIEPIIRLPCGGQAFFDGEYSYRCNACMAVVGSIGQPARCKQEADKYETWKSLGGKGWDYVKGVPG